jgi:hypothetical protein
VGRRPSALPQQVAGSTTRLKSVQHAEVGGILAGKRDKLGARRQQEAKGNGATSSSVCGSRG